LKKFYVVADLKDRGMKNNEDYGNLNYRKTLKDVAIEGFLSGCCSEDEVSE
jgi:hypothetical protein